MPAARRERERSEPQDWAGRRRLVSAELKRLPKPLAVFCYNDCIAADIIAACDEQGIDVPGEVAVLGVDNDSMLCESINTPLSSVRHDLEGMAYEAAALLDRLMAGKKAPRRIRRVPPRGIVTRRSTDILAVDDPRVARALRFIWDQYSRATLSVPDVAQAVGVNRRVLEKAFRAELGHGINEELIQARLRAVVNRLETTDLSITDIASQTGYTRPNHLFRTFRRHFGVSPREYRLGVRRGEAAKSA
jgi:LacI family transcriptional regulator